jgi:hypothetical protein
MKPGDLVRHIDELPWSDTYMQEFIGVIIKKDLGWRKPGERSSLGLENIWVIAWLKPASMGITGYNYESSLNLLTTTSTSDTLSK